MDEMIGSWLGDLPDPDTRMAALVRRRAERVLRPSGALQRFDDLAVWLAGWQRTALPRVETPHAVLFAGDHGVASAGVSAYPTEITRTMVDAFRQGVATANVMAADAGASVTVVDVGVGRPTGDISLLPAMTHARFIECWDAGRRAVSDASTADVLVLGEMGIGNTTAAAAVSATLFGGPADLWTGRGTGIDEATLERKVALVDAARRRVDGAGPFETLREVGGSELVAVAGAALEARVRSIPVILDGYVVTAACAALEVARPGALDHTVAGHCSAESGHRILLEKLSKPPLIDLGMRLGEGTGALAALPLVRLAAKCVTDVATFDEWVP
jgi:nicotinate-nucleotide--dimethylbenzimidazole phosphoribosyltransferase